MTLEVVTNFPPTKFVTTLVNWPTIRLVVVMLDGVTTVQPESLAQDEFVDV